MRVIITGGAGDIESYVVKLLGERGCPFNFNS